VKTETQPKPIEPENLKPILHLKIERMTEPQLSVLNRVLLQIEAEDLADRVGEAFDQDQEQGGPRRIPELVKQFRAKHRYA
jgi:hypothetical protein